METQALLEVLDCSPNANEIVDKILFGCAEQVRNKLKRILGFCGDSGRLDRILSILNSLPQSFRTRVIASAELVEWLWQHAGLTGDEINADADVVLTGLYNILRREELVCYLLTGESPGKAEFGDLGEGPIWSPLGDWMAYKLDNKWKSKQSFTIGHAVAVDFDSPLALRQEARSGVLGSQRLELTESERATVIAKLDISLNNIDQVLPEYGTLIRNFTRRIIVRKSVERFTGEEPINGPLSSEQVPHQSGAIRILNLHLDAYTVTACMETVLHESIHNFLSAWETMNGDFVSSEQDYRPVSPWSGSLIPNASFVHAIFVYYVCHKLFSVLPQKINQCEEVDLDAAKQRLSTFATGFLVRRRVSDMLLLKDSLDNSLLETLDALEAKVHDFYDG